MAKARKPTMHSELMSRLIGIIRECSIGDKLPPERVLAEEHGVCRATVSKVMLELEQAGYITRRPGKGTFVLPIDNAVHRDTEGSTANGDIIITYPDFFSYMIWERVHLAEFLSVKERINLVNVKMQQESRFERVFEFASRSTNLRGMIMMCHALSTELLHAMDEIGVPVVFLQHASAPNAASIDAFTNLYQIVQDHWKSGFLKMDLLLRNGHRQVAYVRNEPKSIPAQESYRGIKEALYSYGLRLKDMVVSEPPKPWGSPKEAGYRLTRELLDNHDITGIVYDTIPGVQGGQRVLYEKDLSCPHDISIVASSPSTQHDMMACPIISSVVSSNEKMMETAMSIILSLDTAPGKTVTVDVEMVEGESVRRLPTP